MDALKAQLLRIQQQIAALSVSQKMLAASLVAIMLMTVVWWARYAGTSEMSPVFDQSLPAGEMSRIVGVLEAHGFEAHIVGDRVVVPSERRLEAAATLSYEDALPSAGSNPWDEMTKQMGPFDPKSKTDAIQNHVKELWLAQVIKAFPGVATATVIIDPTSERRISGSIEPKAVVTMSTRSSDANYKKLSDAASSAVSFAQAGLAKKNIAVVINGTTQPMDDPNNPMVSGEQYERIKELEQENVEKILGVVPPGTRVAVTVDLDTRTQQSTLESYDKSKSLFPEKTVKKSEQETQPPPSQGTEAGAVPNTANAPLAIGGTQSTGAAPNTNNTSETEFGAYPARTVQHIDAPAGKATVATAAVGMPRSYFIAKFKSANPNAKDPDDAALQALFEKERPGWQDMVVKTVNLKSPENLAITMYDDGGTPVLASLPEESAANASSMSAMIGGHAKELAVGALAVVSLFMVSMIVKKGTPAPIPPPVVEVKETPRLMANEMVAGIAGEDGGTPLDAMELGEDAIKAQHMVEQVSTLVKENPDAAASLVKRWLNRS